MTDRIKIKTEAGRFFWVVPIFEPDSLRGPGVTTQCAPTVAEAITQAADHVKRHMSYLATYRPYFDRRYQ